MFLMETAMSNRQFSERLNKALDDIGVPERLNEREEAFAKLIKVARFKAGAILNGNMAMDDPMLTLIAEELEVKVDWLMGNDEAQQH